MPRIVMLCILVSAACSGVGPSQPPADDPVRPAPTVEAAIKKCVEAPTVAERPSAPPATGRPLAPYPPGRALFVHDGRVAIYDAGRMVDVQPPHPIRDHTARLGPHANRVVAVLRADLSLYAWSFSLDDRLEQLARIPGVFKNEPLLVWSPVVDRLALSEWAGDQVLVVDLDGGVVRSAWDSERVYFVVWRDHRELTIVAAPRQSGWPLTDASLWRWRPPEAPTRIAGPLRLHIPPSWSPDGGLLATVEGDVAAASVRLRGSREVVLFGADDVRRGPDRCVRGDDVYFQQLSWSPDGRTVGVAGRGIGYFAAFRQVAGGPVALVRAPSNCYVGGGPTWAGEDVLVPLFGPDCGPGGLNRVAVFDVGRETVIREIAIPRKGFLGLTVDRWIAASSVEGTEFIPVDAPEQRLKVEFVGLQDWCCPRSR